MHDYILKKASEMTRRHDTRDPFKIASELGVHVLYRDDFTTLKGMYTVVLRQRFIFINASLPERKRRIVCAHELGHDALHRELMATSSVLREFAIYDMASRPEYEANIFAAHLLLDDEDIINYAQQGYDIYQIASVMNTDVNLMLIKVSEMNREGHNMNLPYVPHGNYLAKD